MKLTELFDTPIPWKWNIDFTEAYFSIDENKYIVNFDDDNAYPLLDGFFSGEVSFRVMTPKDAHIQDFRGRIGIEGTGNASKVFYTVGLIIKEFISHHKDQLLLLYISAIESNRANLYSKIIPKVAQNTGWKYERDHKEFYLYNPKWDFKELMAELFPDATD